MPCPSCGSQLFGEVLLVEHTPPGAEEVMQSCEDCGYAEEASASDVAAFIEAEPV